MNHTDKQVSNPNSHEVTSFIIHAVK